MDKNSMNVKLVFSVRRKCIPGWPCIEFDFDKTAQKVMGELKERFPGWKFKDEYYNSYDAAQKGFADNKNYDGIVIFNYAHGTGVTNAFMDTKQPGIIIDGLYGGSGDSIRAHHRILKENLPIITVASSDFNDTARALSLLQVRKKIAESTILLFKNFDPISQDKEQVIKESVGTGSSWKRYISGRKGMEEKLEALEKTYGAKVIIKNREDLMNYYNRTDDTEAKKIAEKWINGAIDVIEPTHEEIVKSAKMYLALKMAREECNADAISIDCIMMYFTGLLTAYPCLANHQLLNDGEVAVCESDLDSILTQLAIKYIADRPGFVSDPIVDTATNQIIYAHCMASTKCFGPNGVAQPYYLRSHSEDNKGASIQVLMPLGQKVTTVKFDIMSNSMSIHNGKAVGNVHSPMGCRTKLAVEVPDANVLLDKWDSDRFSWHKVTVYGDYRKEFVGLARLLGTEVVEEDVR